MCQGWVLQWCRPRYQSKTARAPFACCMRSFIPSYITRDIIHESTVTLSNVKLYVMVTGEVSLQTCIRIAKIYGFVTLRQFSTL